VSATLVAKDLGAGHGDRALFTGLDLVIGPEDVTGLVGANGAGKSTLLRLLAGLDVVEHGSLSLRPATATVGYLPQEIERGQGTAPVRRETVLAFLSRRTGVAAAHEAMDRAAQRLAEAPDGDDGAGDVYAAALERWLALGGADLDERALTIGQELGLGAALDAPMTSLSGGQAARAGLASLLLSRYDIFLLDEPTNDLDLDGLDRLEGFVNGVHRQGTPLVVVSHDREFLSRVVTRVVEIDRAQHQVRVFGGGYDAYLTEREVARQHARDTYEEYADTKASLEARGRTQRAWMEKGVRNARRKATDKDKFVRKFRAETSEKQAAKARQTERMIERLEQVEEPRKEWQLRMSIAQAPRSGSVVASLRNALVRRGSFTLGPLSLQIDWADRVAITGANGSGKSTLLAALLGRIVLDEGSANLGPGVVIGEVDQARQAFERPGAFLDVFRQSLPDLEPAEIRTLLAKFGLGAREVDRQTTSLSPGERTRAALALLQAKSVNLLVLDEPTNHLDLPAIEQLEAALESFDGTLLLVTHDRRMLEAVSITRRLAVDGGHVIES
jgi:ATPase subunit of ABC transporter with duplicated ATPase domains